MVQHGNIIPVRGASRRDFITAAGSHSVHRGVTGVRSRAEGGALSFFFSSLFPLFPRHKIGQSVRVNLPGLKTTITINLGWI